MKNIRLEVENFQKLGPFPPEDGCDIELVKEHEIAYKKISRPITNEEAIILMKLFGDDGYFGLASSLMHLIETAPGWPIVECLIDSKNEWITELRNRAIRGGKIS